MKDFKYSVVIPSYNPDEKLMTVINGLEALGVDDIIVVNDGSAAGCSAYFEEAASHDSVTLLTHEVNRGKGAALKTAFRYIFENRKDVLGCVTADGDAQHLPKDIIGCGELLSDKACGIVLGVRDFSLPHVPKRSKRGNRITSAVFRIFVGMKLSDTQTGLRAIPFDLLPKMCEISGERYEYETNMLLEMKSSHIPYSEKVIETVYIEENKTSHFNPIRDSWRIYKLILAHFARYTLSSLLCLVIEQIIQSTLYAFSSGLLASVLTELVSFLPARVISSVVNYILNKKFVFSSDSDNKRSLVRYYILWFCQAAVTMLLDWLVAVAIPGTESCVLYTVITLIIKTAIAIVSFRIQKDWVFDVTQKQSKGGNK